MSKTMSCIIVDDEAIAREIIASHLSKIDTIEVTNIPMMITLTFSGAVNGENINVYRKLFHRSGAIS